MASAGLFERLRKLPPCERRLLAAAWLGLAAMRPALAVLPFRGLRHWAERESGTGRGTDTPDPARTAALVEAAAEHHLVTTACLARALVLCRLLRRRGFQARLCLGAARTGGIFEAHAWVECDGRALTAGGPIERFETLVSATTSATTSEERGGQ